MYIFGVTFSVKSLEDLALIQTSPPPFITPPPPSFMPGMFSLKT